MKLITRGGGSPMKRLFLLAVLVSVPPAQAQAPSGGDTVTIVPGEQYDASGWWRFWWGDHYRDAWTTSIKAEVLHGQAFAGGITPSGAPGGRQTRTLRFSGANGRQYYFRSLDKDPSEVLPPVLRTSFAADLLQDQISSQYPLAEMVVSPLATAAGIPHPEPHLVVLPDDPFLAGFREEMSGVAGLIEEAADEALSDLTGKGRPVEVVGSETLMERLQASTADRVESHAFLRARLLDLYVGDWDRHPGQWRWAAYDERAERVWYPIPLDRDQAFAKLDGVLPGLVQSMAPQITGFGATYDVGSLHWNARFVDRRFLADLEAPAYDSLSSELAQAFTDSVIDEALGRLPSELYALDGEWIASHLKTRRAALGAAARRFYLLLASEVDVHATSAAEEALVTGHADGAVEVVLRGRGRDMPPYFRRRFRRDETKEVRLYLYGGDDRVVIRGPDRLPVKVRIIGGAGDDEIHFETVTRGVVVYDAEGGVRVSGARGARVNGKAYPGPPEVPDPMEPPPRDWGGWSIPSARIGLSSDYGFMLGGGYTWYDYGFRKDPYAEKIGLSAALSTELKYDARFTTDFRFENSGAFVATQLYGNSFDVIHFYGFGNDSPETSRDSAKANLRRTGLEVAVGSFPGNTTGLAIGPVVSFSRTRDTTDRVIGSIPDLYGTEDFWQAGAHARFYWDSRRNIRVLWTGEMPKLSGASVSVHGRVYPKLLDVVETFGWVSGEARGYLDLPLFKDGTHAAARAGGKKVWGAFPWYEGAFLGGPKSLRGWLANRFAGDASLYGSTELRLHLLDGHLLIPSMWGLLGFIDVGRVWVDGESPGSAHWGYGGGLWWGLLGTKNIVSLEVGFGEEDTTIYLEWAFAY